MSFMLDRNNGRLKKNQTELVKGRVREALQIKRGVECIPFASISEEALYNVIHDSAYGTGEQCWGNMISLPLRQILLIEWTS